ncbi:hypothetical protein G3480_24515 [Thiorhodococcus mannitoliphagus]|uniref:Uncharacterized protein n=1 Tax=Thiorhodococcus mannitoliphagus TaxID=329406 RepID=A0A6P1E0I9_9GAMM|nr:hypothetical protein [Thiorhodococcus mannitoliphagus]NEX23419.1 hypothetical protein [Thiorhodococcus mannitoliphagus]
MSWIDYAGLWMIFGLINYAIKLIKFNKDWRKEGKGVFFVAVLLAALVFGPIGLLSTLITSRGKPL